MKKFIPLTLLILAPFVLHAEEPTYKPKEGYVSNEATAKKIAEAVLIPIYGKELIEKEKPFNATLKEGVWNVVGTLPCPKNKVCLGGVAEVQISQEDGKILKLIHSE